MLYFLEFYKHASLFRFQYHDMSIGLSCLLDFMAILSIYQYNNNKDIISLDKSYYTLYVHFTTPLLTDLTTHYFIHLANI